MLHCNLKAVAGNLKQGFKFNAGYTESSFLLQQGEISCGLILICAECSYLTQMLVKNGRPLFMGCFWHKMYF
jgi:hypothetical protein